MDGHISGKLRCKTVANMLLTELLYIGVPVAEDEDDRDNIMIDSAKYIIDHHPLSELADAVDVILSYIEDTREKYPNYFLTGELEAVV